MSRNVLQAQELLRRAHLRPSGREKRQEEAVLLAGYMLAEANRAETAAERRKQKLLARLVKDPMGKVFVTRLTDQCFRSDNHLRVADEICALIESCGIPHFFGWFQKMLLSLFSTLGPNLGQYFVPLIKRLVREEAAAVILPGEAEELSRHIALRKRQGVRVNLNHLGEAILGEEEAQKRLQMYLDDLARPDIEYVSVKVSTIYSQINLLGWDRTLEVLSERLKMLYRAAKSNFFIDAKGKQQPKFVNLDMEEYRDVRLTATLFMKVLDDAEFYDLSAGIVLQAYLPDAYLFQQELSTWAMQRVARGGAPIKIRLVKGANLAMEKVEASLRDWEEAPYSDKLEVDANYKRMMEYGCDPQHAACVHIGIASHNLFDIAYGMLLREELGVVSKVSFEMLEGMADALRQVVQKLSGGMLLYCPTAGREEFQYAVAYLTRRLDENTGPENFLRNIFDLKKGSAAWKEQAALFFSSCEKVTQVPFAPRRQQNRLNKPKKQSYQSPFENEPDTDWSLQQNRVWAERTLKEWRTSPHQKIPIVVDGKELFEECHTVTREDPSIFDKEIYTHALADSSQVHIALASAQKYFEESKSVPLQTRCRLLDEVAYLLRCRRGRLIGAMTKETGKTVPEGDVEVSEAVDFANFYRRTIEDMGYLTDLAMHPKGVVVVASPWNFPCSIPAGGIIAALATGNVVIFKPAPEAVWVGWELANIFWDAGFDKRAVQFVCCDDDIEGSLLVTDPRVDSVILTGATATAQKLLTMKPGMDLFAETGGKNAMIITAASDRDLAIKDLLQSAFGHAGQKCSACSLAILEKEVYDDPKFLQQLKDAATSLTVGSAWNFSTKINPLVRTPSGALLRALTTLEPGEEWLVKPVQDAQNPRSWSPGIKKGVQPGSFMHQTELFGPVLGLMCAENLEEAIVFANGTPYGLTSGLHSLDHREHTLWLNKIVAGNCYINRGITGAIVQRQPFGGCKKSGFGFGAKAGGPNYLLQLLQLEQVRLPDEREPVNDSVLRLSHRLQEQQDMEGPLRNLWMASVGSYAFYWNHYFSRDHDPSIVMGQDNILRYIPRDDITVRIHDSDTLVDAARVVAAAMTTQTPMIVSFSDSWEHAHGFISAVKDPLIATAVESDDAFVQRVRGGGIQRVRCLRSPSTSITSACAAEGITLVIAPVQANGRIELLQHLREVSISSDYHRYGYLGERERVAQGEQQGCCQKGGCGSCST